MNLVERFLAKVDKSAGKDGCWTWTGAFKGGGYGAFVVDGVQVGAHRFSYILARGAIEKPFVMHRCDVPSCVNPAHLFSGTCLENHADMDKKGRRRPAKGAQLPVAKLTEQDVLSIRSDVRSSSLIAKEFGVASGTIRKVKRNNTWKHVHDAF